MKQSVLIHTAAALALMTACSKKSKSDSDSTTTTTDESLIVNGLAISGLNLTQKSDAATPNGFKKSSALASASDTCGVAFPEVSGTRPDGYYACMAAFEARDRFFQAGPTVITSRIESVDARINDYISRLAKSEIPCLDPNNTTERTATASTSAAGEAEMTIPAYKLSEFDIATTFSDGHSLDFNRKYYYSCSNAFADTLASGASFNILLGRKESTWYLGEIQTISPGANSTAPFARTMMSLDADENMEILFAIAPQALGQSSATNPESDTREAVYGGVYHQSAGFAQFVIRPKDNIIGASAIMNWGCEQRLIMNDKAVYVELNGNNYGSCFANDTWVNDSTNTGPAYDASRLTAKGCLKVSGALPEPQSDLSLCEEAGLLVATDAGGEYEDPFARYGIFKLSTNLASPPTGGFAMRVYHGIRLAPTLGDGTNEMQFINIPPQAQVVVEDYAASSFAFTKSSDSSDSDAGTVSAACNATETEREKTFTQKAEFAVQTYIDQMLESAPEGGNPQDGSAVTAESMLEQLKKSLAETGNAAPTVKTRLTRSLGATFRALGTGALSLKYNGTEIGTATVDQTELASDKGYTDVTVTLSTVPSVEASGKFTLEYSGKTRLVCNNATATTRKVNTQVGLPTFMLYFKPGTEEAAAE
jgi:hypothetical protein